MKISIVTLLVAVAALVIGLWPVVAYAPWEGSVSQEKRFMGTYCRCFCKRAICTGLGGGLILLANLLGI